MILSKILGTYDGPVAQKTVETISLEWYETNKRLMHKRTSAGRNVTLRFLDSPVSFQANQVVYEDAQCIIIITINTCKAMVLRPSSLHEMASVCYELGNKHLPLFYEEGVLLIPFDKPVYQVLQAAGFNVELEERMLLNPLRTSVLPHAHQGQSQSLFSKILKLTSNEK